MNEIDTQHKSSSSRTFSMYILGIFIAFGLIITGALISNGLYRLKLADKYVSVKGLSEKRVKADLAIWNIAFKSAGDDLQQLNTKILEDQKAVIAFLTAAGFNKNEVEAQPNAVVDLYANEYASGNKPEHRYIINSAVKVRSQNVDLVRAISGQSSQLIAKGIILEKDFSANPKYLFTQLDTLRPAMLEEATKSAREAALQFAINSNSHLGAIKHANQGVFQILSADSSAASQQNDAEQEASSVYKTVRVVSSIDYFLQR